MLRNKWSNSSRQVRHIWKRHRHPIKEEELIAQLVNHNGRFHFQFKTLILITAGCLIWFLRPLTPPQPTSCSACGQSWSWSSWQPDTSLQTEAWGQPHPNQHDPVSCVACFWLWPLQTNILIDSILTPVSQDFFTPNKFGFFCILWNTFSHTSPNALHVYKHTGHLTEQPNLHLIRSTLGF